MSSKNWLKPATWVGSSVWSVMSVRFRTRNAAARTVVVGNGFQTTPTFGLNWFLDSVLEASVSKKSALAPRVIVRTFHGFRYEYRYTFVWFTPMFCLSTIGGTPNRGSSSTVVVSMASTWKKPA